MIDVVNLTSFKINRKAGKLKILAVLENMVHGCCGKKSKVLSMVFEPISQHLMN